MMLPSLLPSFLSDTLAAGRCVLISFVGAGGKSSTVQTLAEHFAAQGKRVLIATSTKTCLRESKGQRLLLATDTPHLEETLYEIWQREQRETLEHGSQGGRVEPAGQQGQMQQGQIQQRQTQQWQTQQSPCILRVAQSVAPEQGKVVGLVKEKITALKHAGLADVILCEADGAARKALKAPAAHEPVIPEDTDFCLGLMGADVLGQPLSEECVHRAEIFSTITGLAMGAPITFASLVALAEHTQGLFKDCASLPHAVLLNKYDMLTGDASAVVNSWRDCLQTRKNHMPWWYGSVQRGEVYSLES